MTARINPTSSPDAERQRTLSPATLALIRRVVAKAPPLTGDQVAVLNAVWHSSRPAASQQRAA